jgi:hypothetical protein
VRFGAPRTTGRFFSHPPQDITVPDPTPTPAPAPAPLDIAKLIAQLQTLAPVFATLKTDLGEAVANVQELVPLVQNKDVLGIIKAGIGDVAEIKRHVADLTDAAGKFVAVVDQLRGQ